MWENLTREMVGGVGSDLVVCISKFCSQGGLLLSLGISTSRIKAPDARASRI